MAEIDEDILRARRAREILNAANAASKSDPLAEYVANSAKRIEELTKLENQAGAVATAGGSLPVKRPGESNTAYNARITEYYKAQPQPTLTAAQKAAGAKVQFVRTGAAGQGEYKIVYPIGTQFDANGNPIIKGSGSTSTAGVAAGPIAGQTSTSTADVIAAQNQKAIDESNMLARQSAYDLLYSQFKQYGLESLVEGIKDLIQSNVSPSEFAIRLQDTEAYKKRFAANQDRIKAGLRALTPAEYIGLEDQYQNIMRNYGLPASYYSKDSMGTQAGFNKFIANDVSAAELEDRIATAQKRVLNADVNVMNALKQFYPDITNSDILAYTLDPSNALENIKRKVTAAEIGGAALGQGLMTTKASAEDLAKYGITKAQAQQGYGTIAEFLPSATKLGDIYARQGLGAYDQGVAEQEVFGTAGAATASQKRKKLSQLETAAFSGSSGQSQGALDRGRQGSF
jgi:hypothetical protein